MLVLCFAAAITRAMPALNKTETLSKTKTIPTESGFSTLGALQNLSMPQKDCCGTGWNQCDGCKLFGWNCAFCNCC